MSCIVISFLAKSFLGDPRISLLTHRKGQLTDDDRPRRSHVTRKAQPRYGRSKGGANTTVCTLYQYCMHGYVLSSISRFLVVILGGGSTKIKRDFARGLPGKGGY